ncbi:MAG: hypothetical protein AAB217_17460, partial [Chloroflexota bacterium]
MRSKFSGLIFGTEQSEWQTYGATLQEFMSGEVVGVEAVLGRLRLFGTIFFLLYLAFSVTDPVYVSRRGYLLVVVVFALLHAGSYVLEKYNAKFSSHNYKALTFQFYIALIALLFFLGGGTDSHLLLFSPYLLFAGLYIGHIWGAIITVEATLLVFEAYSYLDQFGFVDFYSDHILLRT